MTRRHKIVAIDFLAGVGVEYVISSRDIVQIQIYSATNLVSVQVGIRAY